MYFGHFCTYLNSLLVGRKNLRTPTVEQTLSAKKIKIDRMTKKRFYIEIGGKTSKRKDTMKVIYC